MQFKPKMKREALKMSLNRCQCQVFSREADTVLFKQYLIYLISSLESRSVCDSSAMSDCHYLFNETHEASSEPPGFVAMTLQ